MDKDRGPHASAPDYGVSDSDIIGMASVFALALDLAFQPVKDLIEIAAGSLGFDAVAFKAADLRLVVTCQIRHLVLRDAELQPRCTQAVSGPIHPASLFSKAFAVNADCIKNFNNGRVVMSITHCKIMHNALVKSKHRTEEINLSRASRLRQARERAGYLSPSDAARALGVPVPTCIGQENGHRGLSIEAGARYAREYNVAFEWLMLGTGPIWRRDPVMVGLVDKLTQESRDRVYPVIEMILRAAVREQEQADDDLNRIEPNKPKK